MTGGHGGLPVILGLERGDRGSTEQASWLVRLVSASSGFDCETLPQNNNMQASHHKTKKRYEYGKGTLGRGSKRVEGDKRG